VHTAHPALVLNPRYDPAADHSNAVHMTELLAGSRLVTVEGWGHTVRDTHSACADAILERYLLDQTLPQPAPPAHPASSPS
jgi:pimeloyl-ACP methyl ester carboxylesterase